MCLQLVKLYLLHIFVDTRLEKVHFLTNKDTTSVAPAHGNGGWSRCYYSPTAIGEHYNITCNTNPQTPVVRQFAIAARTEAVELREVQIYGHGKYDSTQLVVSIFDIGDGVVAAYNNNIKLS